MDSKKITVAMIDSAVTRGLKEMEDDPKRAMRKLTDMGRQFSTGSFQPRIFEIMQMLLENEDSPYYELLQSFLKHTDHDNAKKFGINIGYYSWIYFARKLRETSLQKGFYIPWCINFTLNTSVSPDTKMPLGTLQSFDNSLQANKISKKCLSVSDIKSIITRARDLGINTFSISLTGSGAPQKELFTLFSDFDESAFFLFLPDGQITASQLNLLKKAGNTLLVVNSSSADALDTCAALDACGSLYSIYYRYSDSDIPVIEKRAFYDRLSKFPANMLFLVPENGETKEIGSMVKEIRMEQKCPYFLWDAYSDSKQVNEMINEKQLLFSIDSMGNISCPENSNTNILDENSLEDVLRKLMPRAITA